MKDAILIDGKLVCMDRLVVLTDNENVIESYDQDLILNASDVDINSLYKQVTGRNLNKTEIINLLIEKQKYKRAVDSAFHPEQMGK